MAKSEVPVETTESTETAEEGRRGPLSAVARVPQDLEQLFGDFLSRSWLRPFGEDWPGWPSSLGAGVPRVDVIDREKEVVVKAELPGFAAEDVDVSITDRTLTIKASHREEKEEDGEYHRREISSSYAARTVQLPADVEGTKAKAKLREGVLELTVPKSRATKRRSIKVE